MNETNVKHNLNEHRLPITLGTELLIEIADIKMRFKSEVVGVESERFLIVKLPIKDFSDYFQKYQDAGDGQVNVIVRYIYKGSVYGFKSHIISIITTPAQLVFINYPQKIEGISIRSNLRHECILPANVSTGVDAFDAVVIDISTAGCQCSVKRSLFGDLKKFYEMVELNSEILLSMFFPGLSEHVEFSAVVKNIHESDGKILFGAMFQGLTEETEENLNSFISLVAAMV